MNDSSFLLAGMQNPAASLGLIVKVTLLLLAAGGVNAMLRRRSAAARHFVWALALGSAAVLGPLSGVAPVLSLPIWQSASFVRLDANADAPRSARRDVPAAAAAPENAVNFIGQSDEAREPTRSMGTLITWVWLAGLGATVAWLVLGHAGLAHLTRVAEPVREREWLVLLDATRHSLGVERTVRLSRSAAVGAPITWGMRRPIVVLPLEADGWSDDRRRVVLQHELAHVARRDYAMQTLASVTCALYWFHPGVWMAARRLRNESERACDDQVLSLGTPPADYAAHLLGVARGARALRLGGAVAIGMARRSALEGRLVAALDDTLPRRPIAPRTRLIAIGALGVAALPLAGMRAVERAAPPLPVLAVPSAPAADSTFERVVPASPGERLLLDLGPGGDVDVRGWDEGRVRVRVTLAGISWRDVSVDIARDRDGVVVRSRFERTRSFQSTHNRYEVRVPRRFDVRLSSGGGDVTIVDVEGQFDGTSGGGDMVLERLRGRAALSVGGGDIRVNDADLDGSVSTGGGLVTLSRVSGGLRGSSGSGPVIFAERPDGRSRNEPSGDLGAIQVNKTRDRITMDGAARGNVRSSGQVLHITKAGGDVVLDEAPDGAVIHTGGGRVRVGRSAGLVEASTGGGDVTIGPVAGSVRAGTGAGDVEVTIVGAGGEKQTVEITAGVGQVTLELPANFDGRFDLQTAYTRSFRRETRISSDWQLEHEPISDWDDRQGSPRRYVRASGVAGRGRGIIYIKTTNGDITIRRAR